MFCWLLIDIFKPLFNHGDKQEVDREGEDNRSGEEPRPAELSVLIDEVNLDLYLAILVQRGPAEETEKSQNWIHLGQEPEQFQFWVLFKEKFIFRLSETQIDGNTKEERGEFSSGKMSKDIKNDLKRPDFPDLTH